MVEQEEQVEKPNNTFSAGATEEEAAGVSITIDSTVAVASMISIKLSFAVDVAPSAEALLFLLLDFFYKINKHQ